MSQYYEDNAHSNMDCPRVCLQSKNNHYWQGLCVYMAQYYGDNVHGILDCAKGVITARKLTLLVLFYSLYG